MNFFGHAAVASWQNASPALALGAMLPDLAAMAGVRPTRIECAEVQRGVELHHATDAAFHQLPLFASLCAHNSKALRGRGLGRGPARAAAHVGVELALDGLLLSDERAASLYLRALRDRPALDSIVWERGARDLRELLDRLEHRGVPKGYRDPGTLSRAVVRALSRRPRLALDASGAALLEAEMPDLRQRVLAAGPELLRDLRASLGPR